MRNRPLHSIDATKQKIDNNPMVSSLRGNDAAGRPVTVYYYKEPFDFGNGGQMFAGVNQRGEAVALKRLNLLPPTGSGSNRLRIYADPDAGIAYRNNDVRSLQAVMHEVWAQCHSRGPLAAFHLFHTQRDHSVSKYFIAMPPMRGDLLELVQLLHDQAAPVRQSATAYVLVHILRELQALHDARVVHADINAGNLLCAVDAQGQGVVCLADFGRSYTVAASQSMAPHVRHDLHCLGLVALQLLQADFSAAAAPQPAAPDPIAALPRLVDRLVGQPGQVPLASAAAAVAALQIWLQGHASAATLQQVHGLFAAVHAKADQIDFYTSLVRQACQAQGIALPTVPAAGP